MIIRPLKKLPIVSCNAKPKTTPVTPMPASNGFMSRPRWLTNQIPMQTKQSHRTSLRRKLPSRPMRLFRFSALPISMSSHLTKQYMTKTPIRPESSLAQMVDQFSLEKDITPFISCWEKLSTSSGETSASKNIIRNSSFVVVQVLSSNPPLKVSGRQRKGKGRPPLAFRYQGCYLESSS